MPEQGDIAGLADFRTALDRPKAHRRTPAAVISWSGRRRSTTPWRLFLVPLLTDFSGILLIFTVSRHLAELGVGLLTMGLIGGGHALTASISAYISGGLSDRVGRKRLVVPGIFLLLLSAITCLLVGFDNLTFLLMYWLSALALGMIHPATIAWINRGEAKADHSSAVSGNLIRFCISWNAGFLAAQFSGGWLYGITAHAPLYLASGLAVLDLLIALTIDSDAPSGGADSAPIGSTEHIPDSPRTPAAPVSELRQIDTHPAADGDAVRAIDLSDAFVRMSWLANLGAAFCASIILHLFPQLAVALGVDPGQQGAIVGWMRVMVIVVYLVLHSTRFWHYRFGVNLVVLACAVGGLSAISFAEGPLGLYVGVFGIAVLIGFVYFSGIYYGSTGHGDDQRGFAGGMHEATLGLGVAAGSVIGGLLGTFAGERSPYLLAIVVLLFLTALQIAVFRRRKRMPA